MRSTRNSARASFGDASGCHWVAQPPITNSRARVSGIASDVEEVDGLCQQLRASPEPIFSQLQKLLRDSWPAVQALATELTDSRCVDSDQIDAILSPHL